MADIYFREVRVDAPGDTSKLPWVAVVEPELLRPLDLVHDRESRAAGIKVTCPMLALWGAKGKIGGWYEPLPIWRSYCAAEVTGGPVQSGHYLAEEAPGEVLAAFEGFFRG